MSDVAGLVTMFLGAVFGGIGVGVWATEFTSRLGPHAINRPVDWFLVSVGLALHVLGALVFTAGLAAAGWSL